MGWKADRKNLSSFSLSSSLGLLRNLNLQQSNLSILLKRNWFPSIRIGKIATKPEEVLASFLTVLDLF